MRPARRCLCRFRSTHGISLIELMVVLAIVAILVAVAYPSYEAQVRKSRRSEAMELLLDVASRQEQIMLNRSTYTDTLGATGLGYDNNRIVDGKLQSENGYYTVAVALDACNEDADETRCRRYTLTATPVAGQSQANDSQCTAFELNSAGKRSATGSLGNACW